MLFKTCPGLKDVPCERTVHMGQSDDPRCPFHLTLPPPMYQPEQEPPPQAQLSSTTRDMYLSAAELQPTESLPLEFSDVCTSVTNRQIKTLHPVGGATLIYKLYLSVTTNVSVG